MLAPIACRVAVTAPAVAPSTAVRAASTAATPAVRIPTNSFDVRRMRLRARARPYEDPTGDRIFFPRQHLGNDYALNWSLNKINVTPTGDAYRNIPARLLVQFASDIRLDSFRAVHTTSSPSSSSGAGLLPAPKVAEFGRHVRQQLSDGRTLFVQDGALGAHPDVEVRVRAVTDDAATALWLQHMLPRVPLSDPFSYEHKVTVFATSQTLANANGAQPFVAVDAAAGHVLAAGRPGLSLLQEALVQCAAAKWAQAGYQLVNADSVVDGNGRSALLLGAPDSLLDKGFVNVASAHHHLLGSSAAGTSGLYRVWAGVTHPTLRHFPTLQRFDLVEHSGGGGATASASSSSSSSASKRSAGSSRSESSSSSSSSQGRLTTPLRGVALTNMSAPLAHAVIVVADEAAKKPSAKASNPTELVKLLLSTDGKSYNSMLFRPLPATSPVESYVQLLQQGLADRNVQCHVISAAPNTPDEQVQAAVKQALRL